jgi:hypothetical protein
MGQLKITKTQMDIPDPLVLHNSDHTGIVVVSKSSDEHSYGQWSCAMHIGLGAKNKIGFINGTIILKLPSSDPKFAIWKRCNDMVLSRILNSIHPDIAGSVIYVETVAGVWNDLKEIFSQRNGSCCIY